MEEGKSRRCGPSPRAFLPATLLLALVSCSIGALIGQDEVTAVGSSPAAHGKPAARGTPATHAKTAVADPPRTLTMSGAVAAYDRAFSTLTLEVDGQRYIVRFPQPVAAGIECTSSREPAGGRRIKLTLAAYLNGPMTTLSWTPLDEARPSSMC